MAQAHGHDALDEVHENAPPRGKIVPGERRSPRAQGVQHLGEIGQRLGLAPRGEAARGGLEVL
jgi:hypothetical protein